MHSEAIDEKISTTHELYLKVMLKEMGTNKCV